MVKECGHEMKKPRKYGMISRNYRAGDGGVIGEVIQGD